MWVFILRRHQGTRQKLPSENTPLKNAQKLLKVFIYVEYYFQLYFKYEIYNIF